MCTDDIGNCRNRRRATQRFTDDMGGYSKGYRASTDDIGSYSAMWDKQHLSFTGEITEFRPTSDRSGKFSDDMAPFTGESLSRRDLAVGLAIVVAVLVLAGIALALGVN